MSVGVYVLRLSDLVARRGSTLWLCNKSKRVMVEISFRTFLRDPGLVLLSNLTSEHPEVGGRSGVQYLCT